MIRALVLIPILLAVLTSCRREKQELNPNETAGVTYATGFTIRKIDGGTLVTINNPYPGATDSIQYLLVKTDDPTPSLPNVTVLHVPVQTIVCTSTTHVPLLDYLEETGALVGFPTTEYISSTAMRARIDSGLVEELGIDKGMDIERIASLNPSVVMAYSMTGDLGQFKKIQELGVPVVLNAEYLERHPLGRAEWIKFMGLLFDKEKMADSIFNSIATDYNKTKALALAQADRPIVLSGIVYGDSWFLPGGKNYAARMFLDAGCRYLYEDDESSSFLQLSFEQVYANAAQADLWIGVGSFKSRNEIAAADERYAKLPPFINNQVYSYEGRIGPTGGNEYLELGYLRPDIILKDLTTIAHPGILPDHTLYFYKQIE